MIESSKVGRVALALSELFLGRAPSERYVAPVIGDWQASHRACSSASARLALRLRYSAILALSFLFAISRSESDGVIARAWPAVVASVLSLLVLQRVEPQPGFFGHQFAWLTVGLVVFVAVAAASARVFARPNAVSILAAIAGLALLVSGERSWRIPLAGLVVSPPELLKVPALIASIALVTTRGRTRLLAGSALALVCAGLVRAHEPQAIVVICATALGAVFTAATKPRRFALAIGASTTLLVLLSLPPSQYPTPDPHTDLIVKSTLEVLGFIGLAFLGAAFAAIFFVLARQSRSSNRITAAAGGALLAGLGVQVSLHLAGELGLTPVLGVPLPLSGYGGSATVGLYASLAIVLAAARGQHHASRLDTA